MSLRIDKYVWFVRLAKTRTLATELVQRNKIKLNDMPVKPSKEVKIGDTVSIIKNNATFSYKIKDLLDRRVGAKLVADYLIDITDPLELEKFKTYQAAQSVYREYGTGRPSRKDRDNLDSFFEWLEEDEDED
ncbi:RNA-binding S4 domain-containing protein [Fluviicola chungangensis]|jgi:ribosome-associated heat shock protein Hsp15|uniref:RNA-binding S4 domain-containing protein n=1 Tax=Fluviicola chungangensis TaxID=2597671 RepID=A0A556N2R5_9FLAO|nr:RNA-binding S4 domain-containing protein [Fluviicola chungangensis]TSJ46365.1 RNA-binding S4 domain-containing protein [Fluviicola chungangensis]